MAELKIDKARLRMEKAEIKVEKAEVKVAQKSANRKLYEKEKPSSKLHEKVKPSEKLKLNKKGQTAATEALTSQKIMKEKPKVKGHVQRTFEKAPQETVSSGVHREISKHEDDNVGLQAVHQTEQGLERSAQFTNYTIKSIRQQNKLRPFRQLETAEKKLHKAEKKLQKKTVNYRIERYKMVHSEQYSQSSAISKWKQKQNIKKAYVKEYRMTKLGKGGTAKTTKTTTKAISSTGKRIAEMGKSVVKTVAKDPKIVLIFLGIFLIFAMIASIFSAGSMFSQGIFASATGSSYTSDEADMLQVEANYNAKEQALQERINNIETEFSGYDEYRYNLSEIGHDPHDLAALLTALYVVYTPDMVSAMLDEIFTRQYTLSTSPSTEVKYDDEGNPYDWKVLTVTLTNSNIGSFASEYLTDEQYEHYLLLKSTKGNNPDLFGSYLGGGIGDIDYEIPSHYLTDEAFAKVYAEAIKYLGYPYSWGGQSPSTSFDCSGLMYWIYNSTGVYSHSRLTAQGYYNLCTKFGADQRQAGDFIFFTGTSTHATISHIGMYVGDGMMIHSASAGVSFASVDSGYWATSGTYVCYGRLPI